jgi:hypothetical protein
MDVNEHEKLSQSSKWKFEFTSPDQILQFIFI